MAEYGMTVVNGSNELTISSEGITYGYIGKATLSSTAQASGNTTVKNKGSSFYTINWAGDIVVALPVKTNGVTALLNVSQSGSTWTIQVFKGNGSYDAQGFDVQEATDVYVFGAPVTVTGYGMALYNSAGVLSADFTRRPMLYKGRFNIAANTTSYIPLVTMSSVAIVGMPFDRNITNSNSPAPKYTNRLQSRGWQLNVTNGNLERNIYQDLWTIDDGPNAAVDFIRPINGFFVDITGLT